jgi:hypothetical protein
VRKTEIRSRPGRTVALALWGLSYASAITALGLLTANDHTTGVVPMRRGLGLGSLVMLGSSFWLASRSVHRSIGVGTLFPWARASLLVQSSLTSGYDSGAWVPAKSYAHMFETMVSWLREQPGCDVVFKTWIQKLDTESMNGS